MLGIMRSRLRAVGTIVALASCLALFTCGRKSDPLPPSVVMLPAVTAIG